ncbi:hypothetical protein V2G26_008945 [Clonostachys chloroleuca]
MHCTLVTIYVSSSAGEETQALTTLSFARKSAELTETSEGDGITGRLPVCCVSRICKTARINIVNFGLITVFAMLSKAPECGLLGSLLHAELGTLAPSREVKCAISASAS